MKCFLHVVTLISFYHNIIVREEHKILKTMLNLTDVF